MPHAHSRECKARSGAMRTSAGASPHAPTRRRLATLLVGLSVAIRDAGVPWGRAARDALRDVAALAVLGLRHEPRDQLGVAPRL
eukprot:CAMPEP_0118845778 /NCGR_PEP_ID=MMETSP1162-20130426/90130_1 /TAXON_ID=33656 /ORGANISM="Phaeocystis Sp, Strain CCMP2710" /LENGTH=83 /DNA_ID=CAMNT_0006777937 /DNA_START=124 /DNA_END=372 /DNA_ORIENTATION=-